MNTHELEPFFSEPNMYGYRTLLPGKSSSNLVQFFKKSELIEFIAESFECNLNQAVTAYFNGRFHRCVVCCSIILKSYDRQCCSNKCGRQLSLKHLRETGKIENVRRKCSEITTKWWTDMSEERYAELREIIGNKTREYFNSLTDEEKQRWNFNPKGFRESLEKYYETLPRDDLLSVRRASGVKRRTIDYAELCEYLIYHHKVWEITKETYRMNLDIVNPDSLKRGRGNGYYQLDHKYSITQGFKDRIPPEVIGSVHNLEMLTASENASKCAKCSISKEDLIGAYNNGIR